ncbi:MAG TPA: hypothetical protein VF461_15090 [Gemmatimonadaceae bacterium]
MSRVTTTSSRLVAGTIAALVLAACSSVTDDASTRSMTPTDPSLNRAAEFNAPRHEFKTKEFYARPGGSGKSTGITYHGGTVIAGPSVTKVVAIYWSTGTIYPSQPTGTGAGGSDGSLIGSFLNHLGGSPYFNINTTYYNASGAHVLNAVQYTSYWATGNSVAGPSASPTDQDMINLIQAGINQGKIAYDPNTVYAIFTGNGVNLGGGFGSRYCAYHTHGTTSQGVAYFAAMPYNQQYPSACTAALASPNADVAGNSEVNTLAHEIEETTTDALGNAWFDNRGYENADKCAWIWGTTQTSPNGGKYNMQLSDGKYYLVQQNWVNAGSGGCATSYLAT